MSVCLRNFSQQKKQSGAALLAFALILIVGTSYLLLSQLNANYLQVKRQEQTRLSLKEAKEALIGYAVTFPEIDALTPGDEIDGPGYLPCPDTNNNGSSAGSCALSTGTSIGRFPYRTLETKEFRDGNGERLWYVVSDIFRNNPKLIPLNSETSGDDSQDMTVNSIEDIAAVIFAPGEPQTGQQRELDENDVNNYLEAVFTDANSTITTVNTDNFILVSRNELMRSVERRVMGEVKLLLTEYRNDYGAYPWLTPFSDPKSSPRLLTGMHDGGDGSSSLIDSSRDFTKWGISVGDVVRNITDNSIGTIGSVSATTLGINGSMQLGNDNDFDDDDEFVITVTSLANVFKGTASAGSNNNVLIDSGQEFTELGINPGDIVDNISDNSSGIVLSVDSSTQLIVNSLTGGTNNFFTTGDNYSIRNSSGQATGGSTNLILEDTDKDFITMGVLPGDLIMNITDGSFGLVNAVTADTLTLDRLYFGSNNVFSSNDFYSIPRFNTDSITRKGLLSFHREGETFPTAFTMDFAITADSGDIAFDITNFPDADAGYQAALLSHINSYVSAGSQGFDTDSSVCTWQSEVFADCRGSFDDHVNISGRLTSGSNTNVVTDSTADFTTDSVKTGDIVQNYDDESFVVSGTADANSSGTTLVDSVIDFSVYEPYSHVIQNNTQEIDEGASKIQGIISKIIDADTIEVEPYVGEGTIVIEFDPGDSFAIYKPVKMVVRNVSSSTSLVSTRIEAANPDFDTGEYYRVIPAAGSITGTVDSTTPVLCLPSNTCVIADADGDFVNRGVKIGDIIENSTDIPLSYGEITAVTATTIETVLYEGLTNIFIPFQQYTIYFNHVYFRRHEFQPRFAATGTNADGVAGVRQRDACLGYNADCSAVSGAIAFSGNGGVPLLTVRDYNEDSSVEVGRATFTPSGASSGTLKISGMDYYFAENNSDIPGWFFANNWQQLVGLGYSSAYIPGAAADCTAGTDCLTVTGAGAPNNNKRSLVVTAGEGLSSQDRTSGSENSYFEGGNNNLLNDIYEIGDFSDTFNDQLKIIDTLP